VRDVPEEELIEALNAHPRIGAARLSPASAREQGGSEDPAIAEDLGRLNQAYEEKFGFRFVVFVNRRSQAEILRVLRERLGRSRQEELETAVTDLVAIAQDRYRRR
jgi:2-oxo-4-hydroxy-4-carboxy-5-ureidoimidazoline decarboxylase